MKFSKFKLSSEIQKQNEPDFVDASGNDMWNVIKTVVHIQHFKWSSTLPTAVSNCGDGIIHSNKDKHSSA